MSSIARHIIGREQTMLIKVRHILEGTLFVHSRPFTIEVKVRKHKGILLKLNFEKTYNQVNLELLAFGRRS
jgi:hypothetical protein